MNLTATSLRLVEHILLQEFEACVQVFHVLLRVAQELLIPLQLMILNREQQLFLGAAGAVEQVVGDQSFLDCGVVEELFLVEDEVAPTRLAEPTPDIITGVEGAVEATFIVCHGVHLISLNLLKLF